jgi:hypothetical protein
VKLLILGGTVFVGRHIVEAALARGHHVALFNRGRQNPHLFPDVEKLRGDRDGDLAALRHRSFDAVLEACRRVTGRHARFTWVPDGDLAAAGVKPWVELPLWIPEDDQRVGGMLLADNRRALAAGLGFRPIDRTIEATWAWDRAGGGALTDSPNRARPISPDREAALLAGRRP